jgi:Uncharacterised nucleotidyltransferase
VAGRAEKGSFWPSPLQEQLLEVALGDGDRAVDTWERLRPGFDLDRLEPGSFTLLPLAYRALVDGGSDEPLLPRLKGIYRSTWVKNNLLVERTRETHEVLSEAGVEAFFLGGVDVSAYYPDVGLRPTPHLDLLVDADRAAAARARLPRVRWALRPDQDADGPGPWVFTDPDGHVCVVRTSIGFDFVLRGAPQSTYAPLLEAAQRYDARGASVLVPSVTDALLTTCVMGARRGPIPNIQWIADAVMILRSAGGRVDWERFVRLGSERGQTLRLREGLARIGSFPGAIVPAHVTERLGSERVGWREKVVYACAGGGVPAPGGLARHVGEHLVATSDRSLWGSVVTFPRHLRTSWGLSGYRQLPLAAARRAARLVRHGGHRAT